jgi:DNA polymerase III gamma/tau subunit
MRDALSMLDQCAGRERIDAETVFSALGLAGTREIAALLRQIADHDSGGAIESFGRLWQDGKDPATLLGELSTLLRDLLLDAVAPKSGRALRSGSFDDEILDGFRGSFPPEELIRQITDIQAALGEMRSGQAKMRCELCLISLCEPALSDTLPALRGRVAALEQALRGGLPAPRIPAPAAQPPIAETVRQAPAAPEPVPAPQPAEPEPEAEPELPAQQIPAPSPADADAPADGGALWERVRARLEQRFPRGTAAILGDDLQVSVRISGETLTLATRNDFAKNMVDHPDVLARLGSLASEIAGHPIRVQSVDPDAPELQRSAAELNERLEALKQFDIVKFKESGTED